ncbi:MAG TPA: cobyrinate a,c-diamide synthase [Acidimicrobiales bacterium]|nr:cobyrinate a,c-diamide synthase [Acidimicrobiales bacterium]
MPSLGPRLVVAGTHSGVGKTTVATGLMAALRRRGVAVAAAKVGPDFIDPGYHALATGRPGRNLDPWMCGEQTVVALAGEAAAGADILVVEGVMGLFDGAADRDGPVASTASVAALLDAPVVLVVDASALSGSVAALVHGYASWDPTVRVAGVVLNRVGSESHEAMLRAALSPLGVPVLGVLRRDDRLRWRDRHLGLVPVVEEEARVRTTLAELGATVERRCDVEALVAVARTAPAPTVPAAPRARVSGRARVAVLGGRSFSFSYPDNLELLEDAGAELLPVDPEVDDRLPPAVDALYAGGGFPEVYASRLAANRALLDDVAERVGRGLVTWAECGGLLWLARTLDGHRMAGVVPADTRMTGRLTLGYRRARPRVDTPLAGAGTELRGHEFHYSQCEPDGEDLEWRGREGGGRSGFASPTLLVSYLHLHLAADPGLAERFVATAAARPPLARANTPSAG